MQQALILWADDFVTVNVACGLANFLRIVPKGNLVVANVTVVSYIGVYYSTAIRLFVPRPGTMPGARPGKAESWSNAQF